MPDQRIIQTPSENSLMMKISDREFQAIRDLVYSNFGINLTEQKRGLVVGRLQKLLKTMQIDTFEEYIDYIRQDSTGRALVELVNRISTNHTFFFRESDHFDYFRKEVLPFWDQTISKKGGAKDLRIWCAASSSGEEPWSILMTMKECFGKNYSSWDAGLLATDISEKVLQQAQIAVYSQESVKNVPQDLLKRYFTTTPAGDWQVNADLRREIVFRRFNLMSTTLPFKRKFHAIWCRNVMIYFDEPTKLALANRMYDATEPGGYLFIGHSESLGRDKTPWKYVKPAVYRKEMV